jgi:DNA-binding LacI/PurR family transcriptional regulator
MSEPTPPSARRGAGRRVAMVDVAVLAGVSQKTVSRVVNGEPHVSPAVVEKVRRAIRETGFQPNESARALVTQRTRRIGVISSGVPLFGPASILSGLERAARAAGYFVSVVHPREDDPGEVREAIEFLLGQGVEAIVLSVPSGLAGMAEHVPGGIPLLSTEYPAPRRGVNALAVGVDLVGGARAATEHLLATGHRTVWHIAGPEGWVAARRREEGWRRALADAGVDGPEPRHGDWTPASGFQITRKLLAENEVTAIFAANDHMAIGAMHAVECAGLRVPHDVSIVGFDDTPESEYLSTPLTTVRQNLDEVARLGMHTLIRAIDGSAPSRGSKKIPVELVVRASTASPRR